MSKKNQQINNSLTELSTSLGFNAAGVTLSQIDTIIKNNRNYFISNNRTALTFAYTTHGIVQTLVDQPVDDAFRGGVIIKSDELDAENIQDLQNYIKRNGIIEEVKDLAKWTRLYGGGGMVINTVGKADKPLNVDAINENTPLKFEAADLWELGQTSTPAHGEHKAYEKTAYNEPKFFYYGVNVDESRIIKTKGKRAPSFARPQLRGWGMSVVERLVRSLNQYLKNQDLIFELLDEAKIDVYGIKGFNTALGVKGGTEKIKKQIQLTNQTKNYQKAIVKDLEDSYEQKQINFAGLSEMLQQIRIGIANDLKMPLTKIFGQSAAGFASGEDDIENYNAMIESEIRGEFDGVILKMVELICQKLFGIVPDDLQISYHPLRVLSAEQEEVVSTSKINNLNALYDRGLITSQALIEEINLQDLFSNDFEPAKDDFPIPAPAKPKLDLQTGKTTNSIKNKFINKFFKK